MIRAYCSEFDRWIFLFPCSTKKFPAWDVTMMEIINVAKPDQDVWQFYLINKQKFPRTNRGGSAPATDF